MPVLSTTSKPIRKLSASLLLSSLILFPATSIANIKTTADIKSSVKGLLAEMTASNAAMGFSAGVIGADINALKIGTALQFEFSTKKSCYITMIGIDSESVVSVMQPFEDGYLSSHAGKKIYPEIHSLEVFEVVPPTGMENMHALCTVEPLLAGQLMGVAGHSYERSDAVELIAEMAGSVKQWHADSFASVSWQQKIVGRSDAAQYSDTDVVDYFSERTRSVKRKRLPLEINFQYASAKLTEQARGTLDMIGRALTSDSLESRQFRIGGHTDAVGSDEYNLGLSERRASAARDYLEQRFEIAANRLSISPYGEHFPKADNASEQGRAENRRVELEILN